MSSLLSEHLKERGCTEEIAHFWIDDEKDVVTFPLYTLTGVCVGFQEYRRYGSKKLHASSFREQAKYWTYHREGNVRYWLPKNFHECLQGRNYVFVQEGIFSATPLALMGYPVVASLTSHNKEIYQNFRSQGLKILSLVEGDATGHKYAKMSDHHWFLPDGYDVGDMYEEDPRLLLYTIADFLKTCNS